ncbi:acyl-coenzyme A synthetase ACSM3, mitochondrial-like isoform X2 [Ostrea edulis]|uniref:acyl-coenzyme A synthetase ACSM3, mitochondrial-like isoform X2 n=1 Tax=Ostrea edulis TaxID=37623 RepID=UPI0024AF1DAE|nr:acyl-coenzyme A synthetase ACSM3, mitochondrial-like isoform X2 [Ostrea edulis]
MTQRWLLGFKRSGLLRVSYLKSRGRCISSFLVDNEPFLNYEDHRRKMKNFCVPQYFNFAKDVVDFWASEKSPKSASSPALWWIDDEGREKKFNFQQISNLSKRLANVLTNHCGLKKGDILIVILPRIPEWWIIYIAAIRAGLIVSSGTTQLRPKDIELRMKSSGAKCIITDESSVQNVEQVIHVCAGVQSKIYIGHKSDTLSGWKNYEELMAKSTDDFQTVNSKSDEPMTLYFTSGTTGAPKMAEHTHGSLGFGHFITARYMLDVSHEDMVWNISDTGWAKAGYSSLFATWLRGACVFAHQTDKFDAGAFLEILDRHRSISCFCVPPTALRLIVKENLSKFTHLRNVKCLSAGEPVNPELLEEWQEGTKGGIVYEAYGQSETVFLCGTYPCVKIKPGSMGKAAPGIDLEIVDDEGNILPNNEEGNIGVKIKPHRAVGLFTKYVDDENRTQSVHKGDFYMTGDKAVRDDEGYFWFVGRADDIILTSGYRIGPFEVESALIEHPAVLESAVVSSPDPVRGEVVKAFVIRTAQYKERDENELRKELQEHVKSITAPYKYPRKMHILDNMKARIIKLCQLMHLESS